MDIILNYLYWKRSTYIGNNIVQLYLGPSSGMRYHKYSETRKPWSKDIEVFNNILLSLDYYDKPLSEKGIYTTLWLKK